MRRIGDLATVSNGNTVSDIDKETKYSAANVKDGLSFVGTKDVSFSGEITYDTGVRIPLDALKDFRLASKGSVLICAEGGSAGRKIALTTQETCFGNKLFSVAPASPELAPKFLLYYFQSPSFRQQFASSMTGLIGGVSINKFRQLQIPVFHVDEQRSIIEKMDRLYAITSEHLASAGAVRTLAAGLLDRFLDSLYGSPLKHWDLTTLGEVCDFIGGSQPPKSTFTHEKSDDSIRLIQIRDYKSDKHVVYIPRSLAKRHCTADDVMIGRYGPPVFQILRGLDGAYNVALMKAVPKSGRLLRAYLYYFLKHRRVQDYVVKASARAAGQSGLNKDTIEPYPIGVPPLHEQAEVVERTQRIEAAVQAIVESAYKTERLVMELRATALEGAFSPDTAASDKHMNSLELV
jgi:restriction endonuclease S subunit